MPEVQKIVSFVICLVVVFGIYLFAWCLCTIAKRSDEAMENNLRTKLDQSSDDRI